MFKQIPNYLANVLYKYVFSVYEPLYFFYKNISDERIINLIKNKLKPGTVAIDIGANIGFYTMLLSQLVGPKGKVFAFEPEEENYKHLRDKVKNIGNIVLEKTALGESSGEISLYKSSLLNVDHQTYDTGESRNLETVKCIALDDYLHSGTKVDLIKIDIQGYDYFALRGMMELVKRSDNLTLVGEVWPYGLKKSGSSAKEYMSLLKSLGFNVYFFDKNVEENFIKNEINKYYYTDFYADKKTT